MGTLRYIKVTQNRTNRQTAGRILLGMISPQIAGIEPFRLPPALARFIPFGAVSWLMPSSPRPLCRGRHGWASGPDGRLYRPQAAGTRSVEATARRHRSPGRIIWTDTQHPRDQIAGLVTSAGPAGREKLARSFQSWIGHFHSTGAKKYFQKYGSSHVEQSRNARAVRPGVRPPDRVPGAD